MLRGTFAHRVHQTQGILPLLRYGSQISCNPLTRRRSVRTTGNPVKPVLPATQRHTRATPR